MFRQTLNFLGFLWCLPNTLIGLLLAIPYGARDFGWEDWCIKCTVKRAIGNPGAQTWGAVVMAVGEINRKRIDGFERWKVSRSLWRHERRHTRQAFILGPLFLVLYGLEFLLRFAFCPGLAIGGGDRGAQRWFRAYYRLSWERDARGGGVSFCEPRRGEMTRASTQRPSALVERDNSRPRKNVPARQSLGEPTYGSTRGRAGRLASLNKRTATPNGPSETISSWAGRCASFLRRLKGSGLQPLSFSSVGRAAPKARIVEEIDERPQRYIFRCKLGKVSWRVTIGIAAERRVEG